MKPTIIYTLFAAILGGGLLFGRSFIAIMFDQMFNLTPQGWRTLTCRWALWFVAMAVVNEAVWRTQSTDFWVAFKVFGMVPLTMVFALHPDAADQAPSPRAGDAGRRARPTKATFPRASKAAEILAANSGQSLRHTFSASCPGLTRASITSEKMDRRVKPGDDRDAGASTLRQTGSTQLFCLAMILSLMPS